jgi:hypothetical protein
VRVVHALRLLVIASPSLLALLSSQPAIAQGSQRLPVAPLPSSAYAVRSACLAPTPGHASCLALELVPKTFAARAHTHPLGMARKTPPTTREGKAVEVCERPTAADMLRPAGKHGRGRRLHA